MPAVHTKTLLTTGHGCWPPQVPQTWSPTVFANNLEVIRNGDLRVPHCCGNCHIGVYIGVRPVYVNGRDIQVIGDPLSCGDSVAMGSPTVFAG